MSTKFKVSVSGVDASIKDREIKIKGKEGELSIKVLHPFIDIKKEGDVVYITAKKDVAYQKAVGGTITALIRNMVAGVNNKYTAELELVYLHFPATLKLTEGKLIVENFVGERKPREVLIPQGVNVKINGNKIMLSGIDKYLVGQTAGSIEKKIQVKNKDRRVFKDGIFITKKP